MEFYCVKCRKKVNVSDPKPKKYGSRHAMTGVCPKCGTKVTRFVAKP